MPSEGGCTLASRQAQCHLSSYFLSELGLPVAVALTSENSSFSSALYS